MPDKEAKVDLHLAGAESILTQLIGGFHNSGGWMVECTRVYDPGIDMRTKTSRCLYSLYQLTAH
jgi:hypothetical protein